MVKYVVPLALGVGAILRPDAIPATPGPPSESGIQKKSPRLAVLLSLICPGLGHLYCGQILKGMGLVLLTVICVLLSLALVGLLLLSALSAWAIYDAYMTAVAINRQAAEAAGTQV